MTAPESDPVHYACGRARESRGIPDGWTVAEWEAVNPPTGHDGTSCSTCLNARAVDVDDHGECEACGDPEQYHRSFR